MLHFSLVMNKIELLTLLSLQACSSLLHKNKISKLALINPNSSYIHVTNADCSYTGGKRKQNQKPTQKHSTFSGAQALQCAEPGSHFLMMWLQSFFPADVLKDVTALNKLSVSYFCITTVTAMLLQCGRDYPPQNVSHVSCAYQKGSPTTFRGRRREGRFHCYSHKINIRLTLD